MAETSLYKFNKPVATEPLYPNGFDNISQGFDEIDTKIKELDDQNIKKTTLKKGDLIIASADGTSSRLAKGLKTQVLTMADELPQWGDAPILTGTALPTASSTYRSKIFILQAAAGSLDSIHVCIKNATEGYEWKVITLT